MDTELLALAGAVAERLTARGETIAVAESSAGGLITAALLAVPGASAYVRGGAVVYTAEAKARLVGVTAEDMAGGRAATEAHALALARRARQTLAADWGVGETGAAGPTGNRYGDAPGHSCLAVAGPIERAATLETGEAKRAANMRAFALAALRLLHAVIDSAPAARSRA
jgi:PncC family amidohydrolase